MRGGYRERVIDHEQERREAQAAALERLRNLGELKREQARRPERVWETGRAVLLHRWSVWWGMVA